MWGGLLLVEPCCWKDITQHPNADTANDLGWME